MDRKNFESLAAEWLARSFDEPSPALSEACVQMAALCHAMADISARLDRISTQQPCDARA